MKVAMIGTGYVMLACLVLAFITTFSQSFASDLPLSGKEVVKSCWDKGGSHVAIVNCEVEIRDKLLKEMESVYNTRIQEGRVSDEEMKKLGSKAMIFTEDSIVKSQKDFGKYMESECSRQVSYVMGGTAGADVGVSCEIDLIKHRIELLNKRI